MKELEYAALLHDFGKIGVREQVLVKAKKLYPEQLVAIRQRLAYAERNLEVEMLREQVAALASGAQPGQLEALEARFEARRGGARGGSCLGAARQRTDDLVRGGFFGAHRACPSALPRPQKAIFNPCSRTKRS